MPVSCPISSKPIIIISIAKVLLTSGRDRKAIHAFPAISEYKLWILRHLFPKGPPVTQLHRDEHLGCSLACLVSFIFQCLQVPRQWRRRTQVLCERSHAQWLHQELPGLCCFSSPSKGCGDGTVTCHSYLTRAWAGQGCCVNFPLELWNQPVARKLFYHPLPSHFMKKNSS